MKKFELYNPIRMVFGVGEFERLGELACEYGRKPLLVIGQKSVKESGLLDRAIEMLESAKMEPVVFEGIESNPRLTTCQDAARMAKENECDVIIGIGGGSVMDASKAIAFGFYDPDGMWKRIAHWLDDYEPVDKALPIVLVSTLAATGSEGDNGGVITNWETHEKAGFGADVLLPKVSIIDPELTLTTPIDYTRDGAIDMVTHVLESYFNCDEDMGFSDRCTESFFIEVILALETVIEDPQNIEARSILSWLGASALTGFINSPRGGDYPLHMLQHPMSGYFDISHGRGLALLLPRWLKYVYHEKPDKIIQLGDRIFGMDLETYHTFEAAEKVIARITDWLEEIGAWYFLDDLGIPNDPSIFEKMAEDALRIYGGEKRVIGGIKPLEFDDIVAIYKLCVRPEAPVAEAFPEEPEDEDDEEKEEDTTGMLEEAGEIEVVDKDGENEKQEGDADVVEEVVEEEKKAE